MFERVKRYIPWFLYLVCFFTLLVISPSEHTINIASKIVVMSLFAISFNLLFGTTGLLSLGQALFFGLGAYVTGMMVKAMGAEIYIPAMLLGGVVSAIVSLLLGLLCLRLSGVYFTMLTLAFAQLAWGITIKWYSFTGGDDGIQGISRPLLFNEYTSYYLFILCVVTLSILILYRIVNSPFGMVLKGIGQNSKRITFLGMNVYQHCLFAYIVSAFFGAIAGGLYAGIDGSIHPNLFFWTHSGGVILMTILGGMNTFWGPLVGATVFILLEDNIIRHTEYWSFFIGVIMLTVVIFFPKGISGIADFITKSKDK